MNITKLSVRQKSLLAFIAGGLANLAFAPFFFFPVLFISFPLLLIILNDTKKSKQAFWRGWWFGFGHFIFGLYWICNSLLIDASFFWLVPFAISLIPAVAAIFIGAVAAVYREYNRYGVAAFAVLWVAAEFLRTYIPFSGFPWNLLGYAALFSSYFAQFANIGGIYSLSFIIVLIALLPLYCRKPLATGAALVLIGGIFAYGFVTLKPAQYTDLSVAIIQPNIEQKVKWQEGALDKNFFDTIALAAKAKPDTDLVIWPESASPYHLNRDFKDTKKIAMVTPSYAVVGASRSSGYTDADYIAWNSMYLINANGDIEDTYDKNHLVPFGEYVPFRKYLPIDKITPGAIDFTRGRGFKTIEMGKYKFLPLICYEIIFPEYLASKESYDYIINITNDGWFGNSTGPHQHLAAARMRAIEQGKPVLRAAYTGISAVIDANGRIAQSLGYGKKGIIQGYVPKRLENPTIYSRFGDKMALVIVIFSAIIIFFFRKNRTGA